MKEKLKPYILLAPVMSILLGIFSVGIIVCIVQSLGYFPTIGLTDFTLDYYKQVLSEPKFIKSLMFSFNTAFISSALSVVIGVLIAYLLLRVNRFSKIRRALIRLPIIIPHIVIVLLVFTFFSQSGIIARLLFNLGIISDPSEFITLVSDKNGLGIILVYLYKGIPFIALMTFNILRNVSDKLENVAMNLGASKSQAFISVLLPLSMPTILSSFIIIFAFSFGSFEVPFLIGPSTPKALPVEAYIRYSSIDLTKRPLAMVINIVLTSVSFVLLAIYNRFFKKLYQYKL